MQVELAQTDRAGGVQFLHDGGVLGRHVVLVQPGARRGAHSASGDQVLMGDGNSVQRPAIAAGGQLAVGLARSLERPFRRNGDERVELGVEALDAAEGGGGQLERREAVGAQRFGGFADGHTGSSAENAGAGSSSGFKSFTRGRKASSIASRDAATRSSSGSGISRPAALAIAFQSFMRSFRKSSHYPSRGAAR